MSDWKKGRDPHADREARKYDNPIPSREYISAHLEERAGPATHVDLCDAFKLTGEDDVEALRRRLMAMQRDGQLVLNRRGAFGLTDKMNLMPGRVQGHRDGYGFFIPDDASGDLFLNHRQMNKVFDGDRVLVRPSEHRARGKQEGTIVEVIERSCDSLVGRYCEDGGVGFVVPENARINQDILVDAKAKHDAQVGQIVTIEIQTYPSARGNAVGRIIEVVGDHMAPGMEIDVALRAHDIPYEWPEAVTRGVAKIPGEISAAEIESRIDLRQKPFVTIDGEDARDFDDAVCCEPRRGGGWLLYVAIADVSHYVAVNSPLDKEAQERGTSVYFPEQVIPMLPERLSNDLCSLNPHVDRLTLVCEMRISAGGKLTGYHFCEGVIRSHARLTYTKVSQMLEAADTKVGQKLREKYAAQVPHIEALYELYGVLRSAREKRGAIDFDSSELRMIFGEGRKIERIVPVERNEAHKLIEECMLSANVAAADFLERYKIDCLYRVHESPPAEKLASVREFLGEISLSLGGGEKPTAKDYQRITQQIGDRPDAHVIQTVLLRSMQQAQYSPDNLGHFGLAYEAYAHFTSPIRRYPDLLVHRALRSMIRSRKACEHVHRTEHTRPLARNRIYPYSDTDMMQLGEHCSSTERRADEAVRDVVDWLKCEFVQDRVGECFPGIITGVTAFGLFIELQGIYVEGLLHVSALRSDYYHYDAVKHRLKGERTARTYRLGDKVDVRVVRVDLDERKIDFELPPETEQKPTRRVRQGKGRKAVEKAGAKIGAKMGPKTGAKTSSKKGPKKAGKKGGRKKG